MSKIGRREFLGAAGTAVLPGRTAKAAEGVPAAHAAAPGPAADHAFRSGRPIWPSGLEREMNLTAGFRAVFQAPPGGRVLLRIAASSLYRAFVNGKFRGHGPARAAHGHFRVDVLDISGDIRDGENIVAIEVAGYNANSYYLLDQPSFLQAEVVVDSVVLASTAGGGAPFLASIRRERIRKVERYSFQRTFTEVYDLPDGAAAWRTDRKARFEVVECAAAAPKQLLPRGVPYPDFHLRQPVRESARGTARPGSGAAKLRKGRALTGIGPLLRGFPEAELETIPSLDLQRMAWEPAEAAASRYSPVEPIRLDAGHYSTLDFGVNLTGFVGLRIACTAPVTVHLTFDEILLNGEVDFLRSGCANVITWRLAAGSHAVESFEPYTLRYLKILALGGDARIEGVYLREYANPDIWEAHFAAGDAALGRLFEAGRETFRQNSVDLPTDCPSRERSGWLCDSYFTSRVARLLSGHCRMERNFLENYRLPPRFPHIPDGMVPMSYPADQYDGRYIPNWALWFILEVEEYAARSGDREMVDGLRQRVLGILDFLGRYRNSDSLLERLESWVFIEWSAANEFVQDVNYPTNMLYAAALAAAGRLYGRPDLLTQAEKVRETIRRQSFDGEFFVDNAMRNSGALAPTRNRTEVCQYFAFYFDVASPATHGKLWRALQESFGPGRAKSKSYPEIHPANAFIGNVLRLELLSRYGNAQQVIDESQDYLLYMADRTGTLWEDIAPTASCNHGFASHIVQVLYRDVLGVRKIDPVNRKVQVRLPASRLPWCQGRIPVSGGAVSLRWWKESGKTAFQLAVPAGYQTEIENSTGSELMDRS